MINKTWYDNVKVINALLARKKKGMSVTSYMVISFLWGQSTTFNFFSHSLSPYISNPNGSLYYAVGYFKCL